MLRGHQTSIFIAEYIIKHHQKGSDWFGVHPTYITFAEEPTPPLKGLTLLGDLSQSNLSE